MSEHGMLLIVLIASFCFLCSGQRTENWDRCRCSWTTWEVWSECSRDCYGSQTRVRSVMVSFTPDCQGLQACDGGEGAIERKVCKEHCDAGFYNGDHCQCPPGRYSVCCEGIVTCGKPEPITYGTVHIGTTNYNDVATYSCINGFNLTGNYLRTCLENGGWSGSSPRCVFARSCQSNPCTNGGTCINNLGTYTCMCNSGWTGFNCDTDIMPPVMSNCINNVTLNTDDREVTFTWIVPHFYDPHGNSVTTSSNYANNTSTFHWGDFTVQYIGFKAYNGMIATCQFTITVRPRTCASLVVPTNGYVLCNGWRADYGQFCLLGCNRNYSLPRSFDPRQWVICGASGHWTPANIPNTCREGRWISPGFEMSVCDLGMEKQKQHYIEELKKSSFNYFCINTPKLCTEDNVVVICGNTK